MVGTGVMGSGYNRLVYEPTFSRNKGEINIKIKHIRIPPFQELSPKVDPVFIVCLEWPQKGSEQMPVESTIIEFVGSANSYGCV